jgi:hypothetical protein
LADVIARPYGNSAAVAPSSAAWHSAE